LEEKIDNVRVVMLRRALRIGKSKDWARVERGDAAIL
jgi:hypothetical protein